MRILLYSYLRNEIRKKQYYSFISYTLHYNKLLKVIIEVKNNFHDGINKYVIRSEFGVNLAFQQGNCNVLFDKIHVRDTEMCFVYFCLNRIKYFSASNSHDLEVKFTRFVSKVYFQSKRILAFKK